MDEPTTDLETVARLAAEAATRALEPRVAALEPAVAELGQLVGEITTALRQAAGPDGNAARLAARLESAAQQVADLGQQHGQLQLQLATTVEQRLLPLEHLVEQLAAASAALPEALRTIDDLRLKVATIERKPR